MKEFTKIIWSFFQLLVLPMEAYLHTNMGERYISGLKVFFSWLTFICIGIVFNATLGDDDAFITVGLVTLLSALIMIKRKAEIKKAYEEDNVMHTYYSGIPKLFRSKNESRVKMYLEPISIFFISALLSWLLYGFYWEVRRNDLAEVMMPPIVFIPFYFMVGSIFLFIKSQLEYSMARANFLDAQDQMIESKQLQRAMFPEDSRKASEMGKSKLDASLMQGFSIPGRLPKDKNVRKDIMQIYEKLNPKLKDLMNKKTLEKEPVSKVTSKEKEKDREI